MTNQSTAVRLGSDFLIKFGARVREKREKANMPMSELGMLLGLSTGSISRIECGNHNITLYRAVFIARALGTTLPKLVEGIV